MKRISLLGLAVITAAVLQSGAALKASNSVNLTPVTTGLSWAVGIDWLPDGIFADELLISRNHPTGMPDNFAHINRTTGVATNWSPTQSGWNDEIYFSTVRPGQVGCWPLGTMYSAEGSNDFDHVTHIAKFLSDGTLVDAHFATLPNEQKVKRGGVKFDYAGVAGGDLIVIASDYPILTGGPTGPSDVYRIDCTGQTTHVATLDAHLEGITTIPNDSVKYGPWAGQILAGAEADQKLFTIDPVSGAAQAYGAAELGFAEVEIEDMWVVPANSTFYGVETGVVSTIWKIDASQWTNHVGKVLLAQEDHGQLYTVSWQPGAPGHFVTESINDGTIGPGNWEHITFVPEANIDLSVTKAVNNATPFVGETVTFTVTVSNAAGLSTATGVAVKDVLPAGLSFVSSSATVGSYSNVSGIWTVGTLASGATATLTINATVTVAGTFTNRAEVSAANQHDLDSTPGNASSVHEDDDASVTLGSLTRSVQHSVTLRKSLIPATDTGRFDLRINTAVVPNQGNGGQVQVGLLAGAAVSMSEIANVANGANLSNYTSSLSCVGASVPAGSTTSGSFTMPDNDVLCIVTNTRRATGYTTYTQGGWGAPPNGNNVATVLYNNFSSVYTKKNPLVIGGSNKITLTAASAVTTYIADGGTPGVLKTSYTNPSSTTAGTFGSQVLALKLNVDFSNAGITKSGLSSLHIASGYSLAGSTVAQVLAAVNSVLGGGALPAGITSVSQLNVLVTAINQNFDNGTNNNGVLVP